jgi:hypothetical protein
MVLERHALSEEAGMSQHLQLLLDMYHTSVVVAPVVLRVAFCNVVVIIQIGKTATAAVLTMNELEKYDIGRQRF